MTCSVLRLAVCAALLVASTSSDKSTGVTPPMPSPHPNDKNAEDFGPDFGPDFGGDLGAPGDDYPPMNGHPYPADSPYFEDTNLDDLDLNGYGNAALDYEGREPEYDRALRKPLNLTLGIIFAVITIVGLVANGVVFFVIFAGKEINKTVTAMYVLQLAIADSVFLFTLPIFATQKVAMNWTFGATTCTLCHTLKFINYYAGIFFLTAMSIDRYIAVAYSTKSHQLRTRRRTTIVCFVVWAAATIMTLPVMMYATTEEIGSVTFCRLIFPGYVKFNDNETVIYYESLESENDTLTQEEFYDGLAGNDSVGQGVTEPDYYEDGSITMPPEWMIPDNNTFVCSHNNQQASVYPVWLIVNFVFGFLIPFIIILISYVMIIKHLRVSEDKIANMTGKKTVNMRKRVTRMVAVLVVAFVFCWLPYHLFNLAKIGGINLSTAACFGTEQFLVALGFSNSAINPILYSFLGHNFRSRLSDSIQMTRRKFRRSSSLPAGGHHYNGATHSGTEANNSVKKKLSLLVGKRKPIRSGSEHPERNGGAGGGSSSNASDGSGKRHKFGIPLLDMNKKREAGDRYLSEQQTAETTRTQAQTEFTRVMLADAGANSTHDDVDV